MPTDWSSTLPGGADGVGRRACGSVPVPSFTITKLAWLRRAEPEDFARRRHRAAPPRLAHGELTGAVHHRPRRCVGHRLLVARRGAATATISSPWSTRLRLGADASGGARSRPSRPAIGPPPAPSSVREPATTWPPRSASGSARATSPSASAPAAPPSRVADRPSADPTGTVAGFADATGRYLPLVCTLNATKVTDTIARMLGVDPTASTTWPSPPRRGPVGSCSSPTSTASARRTARRDRHAHGTLRNDATREQLARAAVEGVVCNLLSGRRRAPTSEPRSRHRPGGARRRWGSQPRVPSGRRRSHRPAGHRAPRRGAGGAGGRGAGGGRSPWMPDRRCGRRVVARIRRRHRAKSGRRRARSAEVRAAFADALARAGQ